jgi:glutathione S-transferase
MLRALDVASSSAASLARLGSGGRVGDLGLRPDRLLELFEFEACPFCRKVREALSILDLPARIFPCPKGGRRYREEVKRRGGKLQFPWLVDPNTGVEMYESDDIVRYLFARYGTGPVPALLALGPLTDLSAGLASALRPGLGLRARRSRLPERPLVLYGFEASPFCRIVRERLCSLELRYELRNVAAGSPGRPAFAEVSGRIRVPFLIDPNTDAAMFESAEIVRYLEATYALPRGGSGLRLDSVGAGESR